MLHESQAPEAPCESADEADRLDTWYSDHCSVTLKIEGRYSEWLPNGREAELDMTCQFRYRGRDREVEIMSLFCREDSQNFAAFFCDDTLDQAREQCREEVGI